MDVGVLPREHHESLISPNSIVVLEAWPWLELGSSPSFVARRTGIGVSYN